MKLALLPLIFRINQLKHIHYPLLPMPKDSPTFHPTSYPIHSVLSAANYKYPPQIDLSNRKYIGSHDWRSRERMGSQTYLIHWPWLSFPASLWVLPY